MEKKNELGADAAAVDNAGAIVPASTAPHVVTLTKMLDELPFYDYEEEALRAAVVALTNQSGAHHSMNTIAVERGYFESLLATIADYEADHACLPEDWSAKDFVKHHHECMDRAHQREVDLIAKCNAVKR